MPFSLKLNEYFSARASILVTCKQLRKNYSTIREDFRILTGSRNTSLMTKLHQEKTSTLQGIYLR
jgi:hypothetical protein